MKTTKLNKMLKRINKFIQQTIKNYIKMKKDIKVILACSALMCVICACGSTRVSVDKPAQGTQTTITVTTNNPITTNLDADATANVK